MYQFGEENFQRSATAKEEKQSGRRSCAQSPKFDLAIKYTQCLCRTHSLVASALLGEQCLNNWIWAKYPKRSYYRPALNSLSSFLPSTDDAHVIKFCSPKCGPQTDRICSGRNRKSEKNLLIQKKRGEQNHHTWSCPSSSSSFGLLSQTHLLATGRQSGPGKGVSPPVCGGRVRGATATPRESGTIKNGGSTAELQN